MSATTDHGAARGGAEDALAVWGGRLAWAILAYFAAMLLVRLSFSPFLEVDEAQFVGEVDLRLLYANSHPPLYNWILRLVLELSGWSWAFSTALVKYAFLAAFHLCTWDATRRLAGPRAALLAVAASAFLPQVVWMSAHTLAHSTMVLAAVAMTVHAAVVAAQRPSAGAFLWFGLAMLVGALAKYNYFLFLIPFLIVAARSPRLRAALFARRSLIAFGVLAAGVLPIAAVAAQNLEASGGRVTKLYLGGDLDWLDVPGVGVDGFVELMISCLAWAGPAAALWAAALWFDRRRGAAAPRPAEGAAETAPAAFARALLLGGAVGLGAFALGVLAADAHNVYERYLTPLLAPLPIVLAVLAPLGRSAKPVAALAAATYLAVLPGLYAMVAFSAHRYSLPYRAIAADIAKATPEPAPIRSPRHDDAANIALALGWPPSVTPAKPEIEDRALLLWRGGPRSKAPAALIPDGFAPAEPSRTVSAPYLNGVDRDAVYSFQLFVRATGSE